MSTEMRKHIDMFNEFFEKHEMIQVIVSYDCSNIHKPFSEKLLDILQSSYNSSQITLSNYLIGKKLSLTGVDELKNRIVGLFQQTQQLNESRDGKQTIVKIITPVNSDFLIEVIINEKE